jgi:hypothetical protein
MVQFNENWSVGSNVTGGWVPGIMILYPPLISPCEGRNVEKVSEILTDFFGSL